MHDIVRPSASATPPAVGVSIRQARLTFDGAAVFDGLDFSLPAGRWTCLLGPSGVGKTTLLRLIAGLAVPESPTEVLAEDGRPLAGRVAYMAQQDLLLPWLGALDNVLVGSRLRGEKIDPTLTGRARELLDKVGLGDRLRARPAELSGGMRQRVALARTLVNDPEVLLLDEPFAALDFQTKLLIEGDMVKLVRGQHRAALLITHDIEEAVSISDRVIVLTRRPCRVRSVYDIELEGDRTDMMAARDSKGFTERVRAIWADLEVGRA
jgi:ABC-type nitrate/sulfonate/bicarbonate transport system ATPase subunit